MLSTVDNETALLKTNNAAAANQWVFYNRYSTEKGVNNSSLQKMDDGSIYLYLYESGVIGDATKPEILKVFKSTNGGDDFFELATVFTRALTDGLIYRFGDSNHVGNAFRLGSGRLFLSCMAWQNSGLGYAQPAQYCCYSDDDGATWKRSVIKEASSFYAPAITTGIGVAGNRLISCWVQSTGVRPSHLAYSTDNGVTWTDHEYYSGTGGNNMEVFFGGDGFTYLLFNVSGNEYSVFRHKSADNIDFTGQKPYEIGAIGSGATWEGPLYGGPLAADFIDGYAAAYITDMMTVVIIESGSNTQSAFRELAKVTPKSILIDRQKGMAGSLEIVLDNKDGKYSPDNTGTDYEHIFWPNSEIVVRQGYGGNLIKTFAALVDSVTETSFPQEIRISCRDYLKKSLDQIVSMPWQGGTSHNLTYWDRSPEWIFADLCSKAGIATGTIEATGIVINEKTFSWES
jgi:hypothetical protein